MDNHSRIIIYLMNDMKAKNRHILRSALLRWGFCHVQKSVFIYPYSCDREVQLVSEYYCLGKSIWMFEAVKSDNEAALRKFFHLDTLK